MRARFFPIAALLTIACGAPKTPVTGSTATDPASSPAPVASTPAPAPPTPPPPSASASAEPAPATIASAPPAASMPAPTLDAGVKTDGGKVIVVNAIDVRDEPANANSRNPGEVISGLRPLFNACFMDGMKKDPKLAGSVALSAKIDRDGKVSAVTPKRLDGLNDAVVKCLSDKMKTAQFAAAGSPGYAASIDVPLHFSSAP